MLSVLELLKSRASNIIMVEDESGSLLGIVSLAEVLELAGAVASELELPGPFDGLPEKEKRPQH